MISASGNASAGVTQVKINSANNQQLVSLTSLLTGKTGRIRGNIMAKRTHNVARSVVSGNPRLAIDELGVPIQIAKQLQVPEIVREFNIERLLKFFINKSAAYPGCTHVIKASTGELYDVNIVNDPNFRLEVGDILYRDLIDGDPVTFNRAPTLTTSNISTHYVRIMESGNTIQANVLVCPFYNLDFDGDEMNIYLALGEGPRNEIQTMMSIGQRFISEQHGVPLCGIFQDSLIGSALFSQEGIKFTRSQAMKLFSNIVLSEYNSLEFNKPYYTNYEILTMLLPNINFRRKPKSYIKRWQPYLEYGDKDKQVEIINGEYRGGIMDKSSVGQGASDGILHIIANTYGSRKVLEFTFALQQIMTDYILQRGFTLSIRDVIASDEAITKIHAQTSAIIRDSYRVTEMLNRGDIVPPYGSTLEEHYERMQLAKLHINEDDFADIVVSDMEKDNNILWLVISGSKGKIKQILMISSSIGQQTMEGARMPMRYSPGRCLPHFPAYDDDPAARGFVSSSFATGMTPVEQYLSSCENRAALVYKAITTAVTGAQGRECTKNTDGTIVDNRRFITNGVKVASLLYGANGVDARKLQAQRVTISTMSDTEVANLKTKFKGSDEEHDDILFLRQQYRDIILKMEMASGAKGRSFEGSFRSPVNVERAVQNAIDFNYTGKINVEESLTLIQQLLDDLPYVYFSDEFKAQRRIIPEYCQASMTFLRTLIRSHLNSANIVKHKISLVGVKYIINEIYNELYSSLVDYGTSVGLLAAQSMSQPLTQFVLDSHHRAGGEGTKTDKLIRVLEIFMAKKCDDMNNPEMNILFHPDTPFSDVQHITNQLEAMRISQFTEELQLFFERIGEPIYETTVSEAADIKKFISRGINEPPRNLSNWCVRFVVSREKLMIYDMDLLSIVNAIEEAFPYVFVYHSDNSAQTDAVVRVYFVSTYKNDKSVTKEVVIDHMSQIDNLLLRGVNGIKTARAFDSKVLRSEIQPDGSIGFTKYHLIETSGSNMEAVLLLDGIDANLVTTNCIDQMYEVYGIEATGRMIMRELKTLFSATMLEGVEHCHFKLFVDLMTCMGVVTKFHKNGPAQRTPNNVFLRMSVAAPKEVMVNAGIKAMEEPMYSPSANLMMGQIPKIGTAYNDFILNDKAIQDNHVDAEDLLNAM
jgi:DNA-directed RNA polymerase beta' subunit